MDPETLAHLRVAIDKRLPDGLRPMDCWPSLGSASATQPSPIHLTIHGERIVVGARRAAWVLANGEIPRGKYILLRCDCGMCLNPAHMFLATRKEQMELVHRGEYAARDAIETRRIRSRGLL